MKDNVCSEGQTLPSQANQQKVRIMPTLSYQMIFKDRAELCVNPPNFRVA